MQILLHLAVTAIGFFIVGGALCSWVIRNPNTSPFWALPATIFVFIPALAFGCFVCDWLINRG